MCADRSQGTTKQIALDDNGTSSTATGCSSPAKKNPVEITANRVVADAASFGEIATGSDDGAVHWAPPIRLILKYLVKS